MVCIPCFIVPVLLIIWKKFIEPYLYPIIYKYYYGIEYKKDENNKDNLFNCDGGKCIFAGKKKIEENNDVAEEKASNTVEEKKDI